jgi:hypothetical protein
MYILYYAQATLLYTDITNKIALPFIVSDYIFLLIKLPLTENINNHSHAFIQYHNKEHMQFFCRSDTHTC